jgi:hypothetical protein
VRIEWDSKTYDYDPTRIDVATAMAIREHSKTFAGEPWGLRTWASRVDEWDPVAVQLLLWAVKRQAGEATVIADLEFEMQPFMEAVEKAAIDQMALDAAEAEKAPKARTRKKTPTSVKPEESISSSSDI